MIVAKNFHSTKASHRGKKEWGGSPASCPEPLSALTKHHKSDSLYSFFFLFYDIYCSFAFPLLLDRWGVSSRSTLKCVQTRFGWCDMCVELLERRPQQKINGAAPLLAWHSLCVKSVFWGRLVELLVRVRNPRRKKMYTITPLSCGKRRACRTASLHCFYWFGHVPVPSASQRAARAACCGR